jgi:hypothetical protein
MFDDLHKSFDSRKVFLLFDVRLLLDVDCELAENPGFSQTSVIHSKLTHYPSLKVLLIDPLEWGHGDQTHRLAAVRQRSGRLVYRHCPH